MPLITASTEFWRCYRYDYAVSRVYANHNCIMLFYFLALSDWILSLLVLYECETAMLRKFSKLLRKKQPASSSYEKHVENNESSHCDISTNVVSFPRVHGSSAVMSVVSADNDRCLTGAQDSKIVLTDTTSGEIIDQWTGHSREVTKVVCNTIAGIYVSASRDRSINIWKCNQLTPVRQCIGHELVVTGVTTNASGTLILSGSRDNTVRLWNAETGICVKKTALAQNLVTHVRWSNNDYVIAQSGEDKTIHLWDSRNLDLVLTTSAKQYIQTWCDISEDDRYVLSSSNGFGGRGCEVTLWDIRSANQPIREFYGHFETVGACCFLLAQQTCISACSNDGSVRLWNLNSGECNGVLSLTNSGPLTSIACDMKSHIFVSSLNAGVQVLTVLSTRDSKCLVRTAEF